ncbi:hypothetical protein LTR53_001088 [Teratosphaeriaceae sp. CCFEE 6253]|nr:hypothetical protein LTR53_001088 [Teratosphaeriaceae sp. CCFEE 6253]
MRGCNEETLPLTASSAGKAKEAREHVMRHARPDLPSRPQVSKSYIPASLARPSIAASAITDAPTRAPSSPPVAGHDGGVGSPRGRLPELGGQPLSPATARLPPPRTPATGSTNRHRDDSSEYYTAAWGSPYARSTSPTGSARTALSAQSPSEDLLDPSPRSSFSLEHRASTLLATVDHPQSRLPRSWTAAAVSGVGRAEDSHTPRSRTRRWVQLPPRQDFGPDWKDNEPSSTSDTEDRGQDQAASSVSPASQRKQRGHKLREDNRTLNQRDFLAIARSGQTTEMPSLYDSRWAATPPPDKLHESSSGAGGNGEVGEVDVQRTPVATRTDRATAGADTPPFEALSGGMKSLDQLTHEVETPPVRGDAELALPTNDTSVALAVEESEAAVAKRSASVKAGTFDPAFLPTTRSRRRVNWQGKNCIISIPFDDFELLGKAMPSTLGEVHARLERMAQDGLDTRGFDLDHNGGCMATLAQARPIFPDETGILLSARERRPKVLLPDLNRLKAEAERLIEQRLAALGVSIGGGGPPISVTSNSPRQPSEQYPPLPFSPPLPTGSGESMGRPAIRRGHTHAVSIATPMSSAAGPFGHMQRHSTFSGASGLPLLQTQQFPHHAQRSLVPDMQARSPQGFSAMAGFTQFDQPTQLGTLRVGYGSPHPLGSPLDQQMLTMPSPQALIRGLTPERMHRQHAYSQSVQYQPLKGQNTFVTQVPSLPQTPALPQLPEENDEVEQTQPAPATSVTTAQPLTYLPPPKGAKVVVDVAVPTPTRGHQHNISEGLERDILEAELRHQAKSRDWIEVIESDEKSAPSEHGTSQSETGVRPFVNSQSVKALLHVHEKTASYLDIAGRASRVKLSAPFLGASLVSPAGLPGAMTSSAPTLVHESPASLGRFNVAAPAFKPSIALSMPKSEFSFSPSEAAFNPVATGSESSQAEAKERTIIDELPCIFGKVSIPDIVTPARRSKAVAIVAPRERAWKVTESGEEHEDDHGRPAQSTERLKRQRKTGDDGDEVPRFAEPPSVPSAAQPDVKPHENVVGHQGVEGGSRDDTDGTEMSLNYAGKLAKTATETVTPSEKGSRSDHTHSHKTSSSLSALARPFQPPTTSEPLHISGDQPADAGELSVSNRASADRGTEAHATPSTTRVDDLQAASRLDSALHEDPVLLDFEPSKRIDMVAHPEPSFNEIDAVMRQLNEDEPGEAISDDDERQLSPMPDTDEQPIFGVTYLPEWSPSQAETLNAHDRTDSGGHAIKGWPGVTRLNKTDDVPMSDWSGVLSPPEEEKVIERSTLFDSRIDGLVGKAVQRRLLPLEESLRSIQHDIGKPSRSMNGLLVKRASSTADSDADDEDDLVDHHRPLSHGRDRRIDHVKAAVMEVLREEKPWHPESKSDISDLHAALADLKVSFARAASASLDLEDVRTAIEDALHRQGYSAASTQSHEREMSELEGKWQETLAGALEEASHRRDVEERGAETQRLLRLAEDELTLLRGASRDEDGSLVPIDVERHKMLERCEKAECAEQRVELHRKDLEAENEALLATLEEYRMSSSKWRHEVDDGAKDREELEETVAVLNRVVEEAQESSSGMRRRLERLHADMPAAAGQLVSEKTSARAREQEYRDRCERLEAQHVVLARHRHELEEQLRMLHDDQAEVARVRLVLGQEATSTISLEALVRSLQAQSVEQESRAAKHRASDLDAVTARAGELESKLARARTEVDKVKTEATLATESQQRRLAERDSTMRATANRLQDESAVMLDDARHKHGNDLRELISQHERALRHVAEDKERSEYILSERLALSEAKLQHSQDRISHMEERLEVTQSAAHAAVTRAQSHSLSLSTGPAARPEKVSPQALRGSILVLQEQLQDREACIDRLQLEVDGGSPTKLKDRDSEISWLRELLSVRSEDLTDLINTLAQPTFDRGTVRDIAIKIHANLQMEQQEKERFDYGPQSLGGQALASISSFATPKASSLTLAFNKWRSTMESSSLRHGSRRLPNPQASTPSKPAAQRDNSAMYLAGLMSPPASDLRQTPSIEASTLSSRAHLHAATVPNPRDQAVPLGTPLSARRDSEALEEPLTPLFREQSYDRDADHREIHTQSFEDDDLDVPDSAAPAVRSLADEDSVDQQ